MNLCNKNQVEILEVKNIMSEISNSIDGLNSSLDTAEERISKLEETTPVCSAERQGAYEGEIQRTFNSCLTTLT